MLLYSSISCHNFIPKYANIHIPETYPTTKFPQKKAQIKQTKYKIQFSYSKKQKPQQKSIPDTPTTSNTKRKHLDAYQRNY